MSAVCGILAPLVAFTCTSLAIAYSPRFSWTENALSDLGVQEGVTAVLFNSGLIVAGTLALVFAAGLFMSFREKTLGKVGAFILVLATLALVAIGIFPENVKPMHYYVSVAFFVLLPLSMLVIVATFLLMGRLRMGLFTFLAAMVAATVWIVQFSRPFVSGVAIPETIAALSGFVWCMFLGFKMLKEASH